MKAYFSYICFILSILVGGLASPSKSLRASPREAAKGLTPNSHVPGTNARPSSKGDFWHETETHRKGPTRAGWEAELHLDTKKAKFWSKEESGESTKILILPLYAAHLRQVLQVFFLKAKFPELGDNCSLSTDDKLDYIVRIAKEVNESHPRKAWEHFETKWNEVEDDGLFGGEISLYNEEFIDFSYAVKDKKELRKRLEKRCSGGKDENTESRIEEELESAKPQASSLYGAISSWWGSAPSNADPKPKHAAAKSPAKLNQDSDYEALVDRLFESAKQRFFLKYLDEFKFEDRIGLDPKSLRIGIVDQGRESFFGEAPPKKVGEMGQANAYNPNFDLISRFVIDFDKIVSDFEEGVFEVLPITGKKDAWPSDDWQLDWPDSAAIRFKIQGEVYDVYFPTRWASVEADRSGLLAWKPSNTGNEFSDCQDEKVCQNHPNGFSYIDLSKGENLPLERYPSKPTKGYPGINYGYFPLQTPRILTAFQDRPLNAVWSVSTSGGLAGAEGARMLGGDSKDLSSRFKSLEQARDRYEYPAKFELMWEGRASFYPPEKNVFDLSLYQYLEYREDEHYKSPNQCLAAVNYENIMDVSDFDSLLKNSRKSKPFYWEDQEGACICRDWRAACHKKGRSRWAVSVSETIDKSLKLSTPGLQLDRYPKKEIYGWTKIRSIPTPIGHVNVPKFISKLPVPGLKGDSTFKKTKDLQILRSGERLKIISDEPMEKMKVKISFQSERFENFFFDLNSNGKAFKNIVTHKKSLEVTELEIIVPPEVNISSEPIYKGLQNIPNSIQFENWIPISTFNEEEGDSLKGSLDMELYFEILLKPSNSKQIEINRVDSQTYEFNVLNSEEPREKIKKTMKPQYYRLINNNNSIRKIPLKTI